jgi:hypothetical protein
MFAEVAGTDTLGTAAAAAAAAAAEAGTRMSEGTTRGEPGGARAGVGAGDVSRVERKA